ncbi:peptide chain release factor N(5)-glutamine methyltransferase [Paracoccaceae bacterium]|nr:peptide chain release factor N(5)-glutamine methyltransferase [Paracoccaceae bacterium]
MIIKGNSKLFWQQKQKLRNSGCCDYDKSAKDLFAKAFGISWTEVLKNEGIHASETEIKLFINLMDRRASGEPLSQLTSSRSFWKSDFHINSKVLDPRPDTEIFIDVLKKSLFNGMRVLDVGCGSGCIGLSLFQENPNIKLTLVDSSPSALAVAKKNAMSLDAECEIIQSNLFSEVKQKFDLIVSNMPYIPKDDFLYLQKEVILYEPHEALFGGLLGLEHIGLFVSRVNEYLKQSGTFALEFGIGQEECVKKVLINSNFNTFCFYKDFNNIKRLVCVKKDT